MKTKKPSKSEQMFLQVVHQTLLLQRNTEALERIAKVLEQKESRCVEYFKGQAMFHATRRYGR